MQLCFELNEILFYFCKKIEYIQSYLDICITQSEINYFFADYKNFLDYSLVLIHIRRFELFFLNHIINSYTYFRFYVYLIYYYYKIKKYSDSNEFVMTMNNNLTIKCLHSAYLVNSAIVIKI